MINLDEFIQAHKLSCQSRHKESGQFKKYPCTCGRDEAVKQLAALRAESEARRVALEEAKHLLAENEFDASDENGNYCTECDGYWHKHKEGCKWDAWLQKHGDK